MLCKAIWDVYTFKILAVLGAIKGEINAYFVVDMCIFSGKDDELCLHVFLLSVPEWTWVESRTICCCPSGHHC